MELNLDSYSGNYIDAYESGKIIINEKTFSDHIVIAAKKIIYPWSIKSFPHFILEDFSSIIDEKPDILILGTGIAQIFPSAEILIKLYEHRIGLETMTTSAACRTYNILMSEGRNVMAALIVSE